MNLSLHLPIIKAHSFHNVFSGVRHNSEAQEDAVHTRCLGKPSTQSDHLFPSGLLSLCMHRGAIGGVVTGVKRGGFEQGT